MKLGSLKQVTKRTEVFQGTSRKQPAPSCHVSDMHLYAESFTTIYIRIYIHKYIIYNIVIYFGVLYMIYRYHLSSHVMKQVAIDSPCFLSPVSCMCCYCDYEFV